MHYLGFVFVDEPTNEAVAAAMADFKDREWDWYRPGGRYGGYFGGEVEMKKRQTHDGFNFEDSNESAAANCIKVADLPEGRTPYFFISEATWVPQEYYNDYEKSPIGDYYGAILPTPDFKKRWKEALEINKDKYIVVVDAHN